MTKLRALTSRGKDIDVILYLHVLQHAIFLIARPILFIVYSILTCCCDKGTEFSDEHNYDDCIISYEYVNYEMQNRNGLENFPVNPLHELAYARNLSQVQRGARAHAEE